MRFAFSVCFLFLFVTRTLPAQNLVPNPSFEELTSCPDTMAYDSTQIEKARYWFTTDKNCTPDLYNECTGKKYFYPWNSNVYHVQHVPPKSGKGYAGIMCFQERLEVRLKSPLVKDTTYRIQMYVCTPFNERSLFSYPSLLNFYFSKVLVTKKYIDDSIKNRRVLRIVNNDSNKSDHCKWKLFSALYKAKGGENYLTFGGLNYSKGLDFKIYLNDGYHQVNPFTAYYYFIDDVSVVEDTTVSTPPPPTH